MKIPKNLKEDEVLDKIELVINRIAPKYTFHGYDLNDIKQEAFIICYEALERYDQKRPLENFLSVNLSIDLKTLLGIIILLSHLKINVKFFPLNSLSLIILCVMKLRPLM